MKSPPSPGSASTSKCRRRSGLRVTGSVCPWHAPEGRQGLWHGRTAHSVNTPGQVSHLRGGRPPLHQKELWVSLRGPAAGPRAARGKAPCDSWVLEAVSPCRTQASCPPPFRDLLAAQLIFLLPVAAPCEGRTVQGSDPAALGSLAQGARSDLVARSAQPPLDCCPGLCPASDCNRLQPPGLPASQGSEHISVEPCPGPTRTPPLPH